MTNHAKEVIEEGASLVESLNHENGEQRVTIALLTEELDGIKADVKIVLDVVDEIQEHICSNYNGNFVPQISTMKCSDYKTGFENGEMWGYQKALRDIGKIMGMKLGGSDDDDAGTHARD